MYSAQAHGHQLAISTSSNFSTRHGRL